MGKFSPGRLLPFFSLLSTTVSSQMRSMQLPPWTSARPGKPSKHNRLLFKFLAEMMHKSQLINPMMITWGNKDKETHSSQPEVLSKHRVPLIIIFLPLCFSWNFILLYALNANLNKNSQPMKGEICWCVKLWEQGLRGLMDRKGS